MQDIHSMAGGGGGRMFSSTANSGVIGGGGVIDRRLRAHNLQSQALKCPRCDSLNTKFCYYNNYNLSQPRHFCKSCRRYWTKGGVLRNVPVGGGCRKSTKRSSSSSSSSKTKQPSTATATANAITATAEEGEKSNNSHSSSDSSSLTTTKTTAADTVSSQQQQQQEQNNINCNNSIFTFPDSSSKYLFANSTRSYDNQFSCTTMFNEMGSFTSLMSENLQLSDICNPNPNPPPCTTTNTLQNENNLQFQPSTGQWNGPESHDNSIVTGPSIPFPAGYLDKIDMQNSDNRNTNGNGDGFTPFDWQQGGANGGSGNGGFFDLPSTTVDHAYWSQNQWSDSNDHHNLYLP